MVSRCVGGGRCVGAVHMQPSTWTGALSNLHNTAQVVCRVLIPLKVTMAKALGPHLAMKTTDSPAQMSPSSSPTHAIFLLITLCVLSAVSCFYVASSSDHLAFRLRLLTGISLCCHRGCPGLSGLCRFTLHLLEGTNSFLHRSNALRTTVRKLRLPRSCQPVRVFYSTGRQIFS